MFQFFWTARVCRLQSGSYTMGFQMGTDWLAKALGRQLLYWIVLLTPAHVPKMCVNQTSPTELPSVQYFSYSTSTQNLNTIKNIEKLRNLQVSSIKSYGREKVENGRKNYVKRKGRKHSSLCLSSHIEQELSPQSLRRTRGTLFTVAKLASVILCHLQDVFLLDKSLPKLTSDTAVGIRKTDFVRHIPNDIVHSVLPCNQHMERVPELYKLDETLKRSVSNYKNYLLCIRRQAKTTMLLTT